jgi:hypothetical protein
MVSALAIVVVVVIVLGVAVPMFLRSLVNEESRTDARLHDPHTHTVAYAIPNGVDPVVIKAALTHAGFTSSIDRVGEVECLLIECAESERLRVRAIIETVHVNEYDGSDLKLDHVVFEDER